MGAALSREVGIMIGEGAVMVEPGLPPVRVARCGLPEIIRRADEARNGEDAHVQIRGARLTDQDSGIGP